MAGRGLPIIVALLATPLLQHRLGLDRWALFTLALGFVGSLSILDLGISPALTRSVAERIGTIEEGEIAPLITTAFGVLILLGMAAAVLGYAVTPSVMDRVLHVPPALRNEAILAFRILSFSTPLIMFNSALWGVLNGYQRFRTMNLLSIPINALYYLGPLLVVLSWHSLVGVILAMVVARLAQAVVFATICLRLVPGLRDWPRFDRYLLSKLLQIGIWVTMASMLGALMLYADRFIVGAVLSLVAVSYYATPLDLVLRFVIIPAAISGALFPAIASSHQRTPDRARTLLRIGSLTTIVTVFPACALVVGFPHEILTAWLGSAFASKSYVLLAIFGVGMFFSCISVLPATLLEATGRPKADALFALGQLIAFFPAVALLAARFGVEGAAVAWAIRAIVGCLGRFWLCARLSEAVSPIMPGLARVAIGGGVALLACAFSPTFPLRIGVVAVTLILVPTLAALTLLQRHEIVRLLDASRQASAAIALGLRIGRA